MPTLYVKVKFSWLFLSFISLFHVVASLAIWHSNLFLFVQFILNLFIGLSFIYQLYRHLCFKHPKQIVALTYQAESWHLSCIDQSTIPVKLKLDSYLNRFFSVLRFVNEETKKKYTLILFYDAYLKRDRIALWRLLN